MQLYTSNANTEMHYDNRKYKQKQKRPNFYIHVIYKTYDALIKYDDLL